MALSLHIFLKEHVFTVEHGIGELRYPVAENHHACLLREEEVELDVAVAEHEVIDVGVGLHVAFGVLNEMLLVLTHVWRLLAVGTLQARAFRPAESEPHRPARMERAEEHLAGAAVEDAAYEFEVAVGVAESVTVGEIKHAVVDFDGLGLGVHDDATLLLQVAVGPDVVVAREVVDLYAHVGQFRQLTEKAREAFRHHVAPFVPEVEHVTEQIYGACLCLYGVKKSHEPPLLRAAMVYRPRTEVGVAKEIYVLHEFLNFEF